MPKLGQSSGTVQFTIYCKSQIFSDSLAYARSKIPYPRERGPMGGAPYIGPRLGDGPIFEVSVSQLNAKERPGKITHGIFIILIVAVATIDFSLI